MSNHITTHSELMSKVNVAAKQIKVGGIYYHWRNPAQHYEVLRIAFCEWDETLCVVYQQLGIEHPLVWVRRVDGKGGFLTPVDVDGKQIPRFSPVHKPGY